MKSLFHKKKSKRAQSSTSTSSSPPLPSLPAGSLLSDSPPLLTPPSPLPPWPAPYPTPPPTTSSSGAHPSQAFPSYASSSVGRYGQPQQQPIQVVRPTPVPVGVGASLGRGLMDVHPASSSTFPLDQSSSSAGAGGVAGGGLSVALDFGTTFSGVAFASDKINNGQVQQVLNWPGSSETFRKIPTCLVYSSSGQILAWGLEAKAYNVFAGVGGEMGEWKCEWFKLFLEPSVLRRPGGGLQAAFGSVLDSQTDPRLPGLPPGKTPLSVVGDFLRCLWNHAKGEITRELGVVGALDEATVWLTVPAAWDAKGCEVMREAAIQAGLVRSTGAGDWKWRDRLKIISEPEAAAVHCAALTELHHLQVPQTFIVFDGGGGTCDLATYKLLGSLSSLEIAEVCARSGSSCGSLFLDLRFRSLVTHLLTNHPAHLDGASLANFLHAFSEGDKLLFKGGEADDRTIWRFGCFNQEDDTDLECGLINGEVAIPGVVLRREVFDPVVDTVLELIDTQIKRNVGPVDALLLVGGFSASEYLMRRVEERFGRVVRVIARPGDCDVATVQGAARYGLTKKVLVSSVVCPKAYVMKVKLPAEAEDYNLRPAYVTMNSAGMPVCQNRLQFLAHKGAIVRKGQRLRTSFCKYSKDAEDRHFMTVIFTSDSDRAARYADEGRLDELCRWTVDLSALPSFRLNAESGNQGGFFTEFELGLELDSAEARGVLLVGDQEWGQVVFDFYD